METQRTRRGNALLVLRREWPLLVSTATTALFLAFGWVWLDDLADASWFAFVLGWLFGAILVSAFAVVRHAEGLAAVGSATTSRDTTSTERTPSWR